MRFPLFLVFYFLFLSGTYSANTIYFQHLPLDSNFSQVTINGLYQDEYGSLWIGTKDGVKRYNGNYIESVDLLGVNNWVQSNLVPTVCGDKNGHVYINTDYNIIEYDLKQEKADVIFKQCNIKTLPSVAFSYGNNSLWITSKDSIFKYENKYLQLKHILNDKDMDISAIKESSDGTLYIGTKHKGAFYIKQGKVEKLLSINSEVITINEDSKKNIWIGTFSDGLFRISYLDKNVKQYTSPDLSSNYVRAVCEDDNENIWIGTMMGVDLISEKTKEIVHYGLTEKGKSGLSNLSVWIIMKDDQSTMWLGTYYGGLNFYNKHTNILKYNDLGLTINGGPIVSKIVEDKAGMLWIGTEGNGLISYNINNQKYTYYTKEQNTISHNNIKSLCYDQKLNTLWIGTHLGGLCSYNLNTKQFKHYTIDHNNDIKRSEVVQAIVKYEDVLFLGTLSGIYYMNTKDESIKKIDLLDKYIYAVNALLIDKDENLWIGGNNLCSYNIKQNYAQSFEKELTNITTSEKNTITSLALDNENRIIASTAGSGILIYNQDTELFEQINRKNSNVASDYVSVTYPLSNDYLLAGSKFGLSCINLKEKKSYNYDSQNGFALNSMIPGDIIRDWNGNIVMGGTNGIAVVSENRLFSENLPVRMYFSKLRINNKEVSVNDEYHVLAQSLQSTKEINLNHDENNISIEIGDNNFVNFGQPQYQYMLEGYDKNWIDFQPQTSINYMNLPDGEYMLKVRNILFREEANPEEIDLKIKIIPPVYATWYAYTFYTILILTIITSIVYFYRSKLLLRASLEMERYEKQQKDIINESKMRFLGNISHELKTPITLISGQLELLLMSNSISGTILNNIKEVHNRAYKMSKLINELLDFLKSNKEISKLKVEKNNIVSFTQEIYESFISYAKLKNINFDFKCEFSEFYLWFDAVQMQKVFSNILSNAFKFTSEKGNIRIYMEKTTSSVNIVFEDSGIGIPKDMTDKIFERFYQVNNSINNELSNTGSGIGLSLSSGIVNAHHGKIKVDSEEGKGSVFTVELPIGKKHFTNDKNVEMIEDNNNSFNIAETQTTNEDKAYLDDLANQQKEFNKGEQLSLLIAEDDAALRSLLVNIFGPLFQIYEAENGEEAFKIAQINSPDLILSDIMMPGISGIALCNKIKSNFDTSHIPVVLLTALSSEEHAIRGLNCGADDYITKPFSIKLLVTKCVNLLNNRRKLQERYKKSEVGDIKKITTTPIDQEFIDKVVQIIEKNIESGNIDVSILCSELVISRTKLFQKMKGITGETPHDFIQNIKLKTAARMLRENPELNISDISYQLNFSSLNYFGKSFKDYFGLSPSSYRKSYLDKINS